MPPVPLEMPETPEMQAKVPVEVEVEVDPVGIRLQTVPPQAILLQVKVIPRILQPRATRRLIIMVALVVLVLPLLPVVLVVEEEVINE